MIRSGIFAILWSTATVRVNRLCPNHVSSMVQTMLEVSYRGIGHTTGSYLGGVLCKAYDINTAFIIVGKGLGTFLCVVGAIMSFWSNHHHHHHDDHSNKVKTN
jgi:predicted MFS family arabinose efflux permease